MKTSALQIAGIAFYEFRMQWRRRTVLIMFGVFSLAIVALQFPVLPAAAEMFSEVSELPMSVFILLGTIPAITAEVVPLDRQLKLSELLRTLPMSRPVYLAGKVLSVWLGLLLGIVLVAVGLGVFTYTSLESLNLRMYVHVWLLLLPYILMAGSVPLLAASVVSTRREAALLSLLIAPYLLVAYTIAMVFPPDIPGAFAFLAIHLAIVSLFLRTVFSWQEQRQ